MKIFWLCLLLSGFAHAAIPIVNEAQMEELGDRIRGFDHLVGCELGPVFISEEARRLGTRLLRSIRPNEKGEVETERYDEYRRLAAIFNREVARPAKQPPYHIPLLPINRHSIARAVLADFIDEEGFFESTDNDRDAINMTLSRVRWQTLPVAIRLLERAKKAGRLNVSFEVPDVLLRAMKFRRPGIERILQKTERADFDPVAFTCEVLLE